jgi:anti-anti-sigma factor
MVAVSALHFDVEPEDCFSVGFHLKGDGVVILVDGSIDLCSAAQLVSCALALLRHGSRLTVDLGGVPFMDSSGWDALLRIQAAAIDLGGSLTLRSPSRQVQRFLQIATAYGLRSRAGDGEASTLLVSDLAPGLLSDEAQATAELAS